jgi:hypothetical protein
VLLAMIWEDHVARMRQNRNAYSVSVGKLEGKRPLGRPRRRSENNIKMNLRKINGVWTGLMWLRMDTSGVLL